MNNTISIDNFFDMVDCKNAVCFHNTTSCGGKYFMFRGLTGKQSCNASDFVKDFSDKSLETALDKMGFLFCGTEEGTELERDGGDYRNRYAFNFMEK